MRRISVTLTEAQIVAMTKTVTRRSGWEKLVPGQVLQPVRKAMGLRKGEQQVCIGSPIVVRSVRREPLQRMLDELEYGKTECELEGFPEMSPGQFVEMFCKSHKGCTPDSLITRIEFDYVRGNTTSEGRARCSRT